jgi:DNA-binding transcriptional MerR regulator
MGDRHLSIGELSRRTGVGHRLLRYYEEQGLLTSQRSGGGHRLYEPSAVEAVRRIRMLLDAGLPTRIISEVMPCFDDDGTQLDSCVADVVRAHLAVLQKRIDDLSGQQVQLAQLLPEHRVAGVR